MNRDFKSISLYVDNFLKKIKTTKSHEWRKIYQKEVLRVFKIVANTVPAYKDFLKKNKIKPEKIKTFSDFQLIPPTNKENYINYYPYQMLVKNGSLSQPFTIHATSGSTGEPTYFNRQFYTDLRRAFSLYYFLQHDDNFLKKPFLFVIAFGMGIWSAGMGIYTGAYLLNNAKNLPMSIISPGVNLTEVIKILRKLGKTFKQIIIAGYPPFVKDIIDEIKFLKINVRDIHFKFIFTGEAFPEELRDYISQNLNVKNIFIDTMNTYGTSELGATGIETPLSIFIKRKAYENQNLFKYLFGEIEKTPTLVQYIPYFVNIECVNGELLYTADSSIPLVRYASGDHGGVFFFDEMVDKFSELGMNLMQELKKVNLDKYINQLPFSYVYERKNMATTLYGLLIYPEFIKTALFDKKLTNYVTGRFVMATRYDKKNNQYLEINIELQKNVKPSKWIEKLATKIIVETLRKRSSEYRELSNNYKEKVWPKIILWPYGYEKYFDRNLNKQKWILR